VTSSSSQSEPKAIHDYLDRQISLKNSRALLLKASLYRHGIGVAQSFEESERLLLLLADELSSDFSSSTNSPIAAQCYFSLGVLYEAWATHTRQLWENKVKEAVDESIRVYRSQSAAASASKAQNAPEGFLSVPSADEAFGPMETTDFAHFFRGRDLVRDEIKTILKENRQRKKNNIPQRLSNTTTPNSFSAEYQAQYNRLRKRAVLFYLQAVDAKSPEACVALVGLFPSQKYKFLTVAAGADFGHAPVAVYTLLQHYLEDDDMLTQADCELMCNCLASHPDQSSADVQFLFAYLLLQNRVPEPVVDGVMRMKAASHPYFSTMDLHDSLKLAVAMMRRAAVEFHSGAALWYYARMLFTGQYGVEVDVHTAWKCVLDAVDQGYGEAVMEAGQTYLYGLEGVVAADVDRAYELFEEAAYEHDIADAFCALAAMHYQGLSKYAPEPDARKAFELYQRASEMNSTRAWRALADLYRHGEGVPQDVRTAEYFEQLANKADAQ
jgi:TPR repeat protein